MNKEKQVMDKKVLIKAQPEIKSDPPSDKNEPIGVLKAGNVGGQEDEVDDETQDSQLYKEREIGDSDFVVFNLQKTFKSFKAVNGLSFVVPKVIVNDLRVNQHQCTFGASHESFSTMGVITAV